MYKTGILCIATKREQKVTVSYTIKHNYNRLSWSIFKMSPSFRFHHHYL